ncbi:MAG: hypothetical protein FWG35_03555, partial [Spirochaetaceae bacterium]|nr:hypothetical protein [Spirochaetaceae bacterium]
SFPNNAVLAEFGLSGLTPPVGCTFIRGAKLSGVDLFLEWAGSDATKTADYSLKVKAVLGGASPIISDSNMGGGVNNLTTYDWDMGSRWVQLWIVKSTFIYEGETHSAGRMELSVDFDPYD